MAKEKVTTKSVEDKPAPKKRGPKPKIDQYYVNPPIFKQEIQDYYETEYCPPSLAESLRRIAYGLGNKSNFINYTYKDEMIGDALVKMYTALKNKKFKRFNKSVFQYHWVYEFKVKFILASSLAKPDLFSSIVVPSYLSLSIFS